MENVFEGLVVWRSDRWTELERFPLVCDSHHACCDRALNPDALFGVMSDVMTTEESCMGTSGCRAHCRDNDAADY